MLGLLAILFFVFLAAIPVSLIVLAIRAICKKRIKANVIAVIGSAVSAALCFVLVGALGCGHQWEKTDEISPTCTEDGRIVYQCALCGQDKTETLEKTGHTMAEDYRKEPTPLEDGEIVEICSVCGYKHIAPLDKTSNDDKATGNEADTPTESDGLETSGTLDVPTETGDGKSPEVGNSADTVFTEDGFTLLAYPLGGAGENTIFSDERFDIINLSLEDEKSYNSYTYELIFKGALQNHSGRDWEAVTLSFCLLDGEKSLVTEMDAGFTAVGNSMDYLKDGEEREFTVSVLTTKYGYDHAEWIALSGLTTFG